MTELLIVTCKAGKSDPACDTLLFSQKGIFELLLPAS